MSDDIVKAAEIAKAAENILDRPYADPDDDAAMLARFAVSALASSPAPADAGLLREAADTLDHMHSQYASGLADRLRAAVASSPDGGLRAALGGSVSTNDGRTLCIHLPENFTAGEAKDVLLALASSPAPAGLTAEEYERLTTFTSDDWAAKREREAPAPAGLDERAVLAAVEALPSVPGDYSETLGPLGHGPFVSRAAVLVAIRDWFASSPAPAGLVTDGLSQLITTILRKYGGTMKGRGDHDIFDALVRYRDDLRAATRPAPEGLDVLPRCEHGAIREPCIPCSEYRAALAAPAPACPACSGSGHEWWPVGDDSYACLASSTAPAGLDEAGLPIIQQEDRER